MQRRHNQNTTKGQFLSQKLAERLSKIKITRDITYMQRHIMIEIANHSRSTDLERSVKCFTGGGGAWNGCVWGGGSGGGRGGLNRLYVATTLILSPAVVYTKHLFSPSEGFLTHQCNISENRARASGTN